MVIRENREKWAAWSDTKSVVAQILPCVQALFIYLVKSISELTYQMLMWTGYSTTEDHIRLHFCEQRTSVWKKQLSLGEFAHASLRFQNTVVKSGYWSYFIFPGSLYELLLTGCIFIFVFTLCVYCADYLVKKFHQLLNYPSLSACANNRATVNVSEISSFFNFPILMFEVNVIWSSWPMILCCTAAALDMHKCAWIRLHKG